MTSYRKHAVPVLLSLFATAPLSAQIVRGRALEVNTQAPIAGALVSLLGVAGDSTLVSVLSAVNGEYAIRAPVAGTYRLAVKRIGVQRSISEPFVLGLGESLTRDVRLAAVAVSLPEVTVSGLCVSRPRELGRIAALWEEIRTALEAAEISFRDRLMAARITRYAAEVDPASLRAVFDWRSDAEVMTSQPFESPSGESLSERGYWRELSQDSVVYLAPDARALLSNAFIHDHCFSIARSPAGRPDLVGLAFAPVRDRQLPDITGTIWLDDRQFELRHIEYRYTQLPDIPHAARVGGEVHYARLASGAWSVRRWYIRTPQFVAVADAVKRRWQLYEVGGSVSSDGMESSIALSRITGVLRDSTGRPLSGAVVRAIGTYQQTVTDAQGTFTLDSLSAGAFSIVARTPGYDAFAVVAASRRVVTQPGRTHRADLKARNMGEIRDEVCPDPDLKFIQRARGRGALRILVIDTATATPMQWVRFLAGWPSAWENITALGAPGDSIHKERVTDMRGSATYCDLPIGDKRDIAIWLAGTDSTRTPVMSVTVDRRGLTGRVVFGRR